MHVGQHPEAPFFQLYRRPTSSASILVLLDMFIPPTTTGPSPYACIVIVFTQSWICVGTSIAGEGEARLQMLLAMLDLRHKTKPVVPPQSPGEQIL